MSRHSLTRRLAAGLLAAALLPLGAPIGGAVVSAAPCDPFTTPPVYDPTTPTATSVLGFALGTQEVTPRAVEPVPRRGRGRERPGRRGDGGRRRSVAGTCATRSSGRRRG